jgi:hypothetical protein
MERSLDLFAKPEIKINKAFGGVGQAQGAVQFGFGNVDTEMKGHVKAPKAFAKTGFRKIYLVNAGDRPGRAKETVRSCFGR